MFINYIKLYLRTLWRNGTHTFVNVFGLSLGITCTIIIFLILRLELSFDSYHNDADRIYRVVCEFTKSDSPGYSSAATYPMIPAIKNDFPDAEYSVLLDGNIMPPVMTITRADGSKEKFKETKAVFVDAAYMKIFKQQWIYGDTSALRRERTVVLTQSVAKKYFGDESPMNKVIDFNGWYDITVSGLVADPPLNTDFPFAFYMSNNVGAKKRGWEDWNSSSSSINCLVKLNPGVTQEQFDAKLDGWHRKYFTGNNEEDGKYRRYFLQPLSEMHFDTRFDNFEGRIVSAETLYTLGLIGIVLLLTACINFINLNTVLIIDRSKEAGVRKVLGSGRGQIVGQFLGETLTITLISMLISTGLVELSVLNLTPVLGYRLEFHPFTDVWTMLFMIFLPIIVTGLAGLYPALSLSRFQPVKALKSRFASDTGKGMTLRRSLIVVQLIISQVLVVCTIIIVQQINFFMAQPLGINSNAVVEFQIPDNKKELVHLLKDRINAIPGVENFSMSNTGATSTNQWKGEVEATVNGKLIKENAALKIADEDFLNTYGINLLFGENLVQTDSATRFLVNKRFTSQLGLKNPEDAIGIPVNVWGSNALITGIVNDFNVTSLHNEIEPTIIFCSTSRYFRGAVKVETAHMTETLNKVKDAWESVYPKHVYEQTFLDDTIEHFYDAEKRTSTLVGLFAGVAIFIGCIGLFGLISFMAKRKTKEIGIRKTLGASVTQVISLFTKEFSLLVLISFVMSVPLSYYFMDKWLDNFKYQIAPGVLTFSLGALLTFTIVIVTIGVKSYRAATANPVNALRDE